MASSSRGKDDGPAPDRQARYRWAARLSTGKEVLDAACGAGWGTATLAGTAARAVGVDLSQPAIADARERHGDAAEFRVGDLRKLPFADRQFDLVVCFEAIAQVAAPAEAVDELSRVLRADGVLAISVPNPRVYPPGNPLHLSESTPEELRDLLAARFAAVAVHPQRRLCASLLGDFGRETGVSAADLPPRPRGSELHAVAVATDGQLPPPPSELALGGTAGCEERRQELDAWRRRAVEAEAEALALRKELQRRQS